MAVGQLSNVYPGGERPSGLPVDIVQQLTDARKQQRVSPLEEDRKELQSEQELLQQLNGVTSKIGDAAGGLSSASDLKSFTAESGDSAAVGVEVTGSPQAGNYSVDLSGASHQLAQSSNLLVGVDTDGTDDGAVDNSEGITDPADSTAINDGVDVQFSQGGSDYTYTTDSDTTLNSLAETISADGNGVQASAVNLGTSDSPAYALQLQSESSGGGDNRITDTNSNEGITTSGGSLFAGTTDGSDEQEVARSGQNAVFDVDGVTYERTSNQVSDVVDGLNLDLKEAGRATNVAVSQSTEEPVKAMQAVVDSFNKTNGFIDKSTSYDVESGEAGPLNGNSTVRRVDSSLQQAFYGQAPGVEDNNIQTLTQVGVEFQRDGSLSFDQAKFENALTNSPDEVADLLAGDNGVMTRVKETADGLTNAVDGVITTSLDTLDNRDSRLQDEIDQAQSRLQDYEQRLVDRYSQLEETVTELNGVQERLDGLLNTSSGG